MVTSCRLCGGCCRQGVKVPVTGSPGNVVGEGHLGSCVVGVGPWYSPVWWVYRCLEMMMSYVLRIALVHNVWQQGG